ncbi:hypothetical protein GCM10028801_27710 [Nocardioides maradonensis]
MNRSRILVLGAVLVAVVAVGAGALALSLRTTTGQVAMPPDAATPQAVVKAYLAAMNAHDCNTAEALSTGNGVQETHLWCDDVGSLGNISVRSALREKPGWSGQPASAEVMNVPTEFDLDWRAFHDDGSLPEGRTPWSYLLVRRSPDQPWRIFDQGQG